MSVEAGGAAPAVPDGGREGGPLRDRNFLPYFVGNLVSSCGTWFHNIAQTLLVYRLTGSVFLVGVVNLAQFAGIVLLGASAGVAADRYDRRRLLLATQTASATVSAALAVLTRMGRVNVTVIVVSALLMGVALTYTTPALLALVPQLVESRNLGPAVALNIVTFNVARAVGPVLGAIVVQHFGTAAAFGFNSISFLALIAGLLAVTPRTTVNRDRTRTLRLRDTVRSLRTRPHIGWLFVIGMCASVAIDPVTTLTPAYATEIFHRSDTVVGWFAGAFGLGAVLAGVLVSRQPHANDRLLSKRMAMLAGSMLVFASTNILAIGLVALIGAGYAFIGTAAAALTRVQQSSEPGEHGRLMALWSMAVMGSRPLASLVDGAVATWTDVRLATLLILFPAIGGSLLMLSRSRSVRSAADANATT